MSPPPARRWTRVLAIIGTALLTLVVTVLALLQLPPVATWAMRQLVTVVPLNSGYRLEVGGVSGDWLHRLALDNVRLLRGDRELARIDRLTLGYDLRQLRGEETRLRELTVNGALVVARREGDSWDLANALERSADTTGGGGFRVQRLTLRDVQLAAALSPDSTVRVRGLTLDGRDLVIGRKALLKLDNLNAAVAAPGNDQWFAVATRGALTAEELRLDPLRIQTEATRIAGRIVLPRDRDNPRLVDRLDIQLRATPLMLADLAAVVPAVTPEGALRFDASAEGNSEGLVTAHLGASLDEATVTLDGIIPLARRTADYRLQGTVRRLDPSRLYQSAPAGSLNGRVEARLSGPKLAQADGWVELRLTSSRLAGNSVRRLDFRADLQGGSAGVVLRGNVEQGTLTASGRVRPFDSIPGYRLSGSAANLPGTDAVARGLTGDSGTTALDVRFQIAGSGISRKEARLSGRVDLAALRESGEQTPLGHAAISLAGGRLDARPELLVGGGTITADAIARLGDTVTYELRRGVIERVDLAQLTADTAMGPLSGEFALTGRGVTPAEASVTARVALHELSYGGRAIQQVNGRLRLAAGRAYLKLQGLLQGGRLTIDANGRPFDTTASFTLSRAALDGADLGSFLGRPDLAGSVTLRATATGRWRGDLHLVNGRVTVAPSRLGRIRVGSGSVNGRLRGHRLTYDGFLETNGGAFALQGDGQPLGETRSFAIRRGRADSVDLGTLLGRPDLRTGINARFNADVAMLSPDSIDARLALELLPSRINQAQLTAGQIDVDWKAGTVRGDLKIDARDGALAAKVTGRTGDSTRLHTDGTLRLERLARWTGNSAAEGRLESNFGLNAAADSSGLVSLDGTINAIGGIGGVRLNAVHLALQPDTGAILVDTLLVRSNVGVLDGGGRIALRSNAGVDTLRLTGFTRNLEPLAALAGLDSVSLDSSRLALSISGPAWHWRLDGNAEARGVLSAGNLASLLKVQGGATVDSTRLAGMQGELQVENAAYGTLRIPEARLIARYDSLVALDANVSVGDSVRIATALRGSTAGNTKHVTLQRLDLTEGGRSWTLEQPAALTLGPRVVVDGFGLRSGTRSITVDGTFDRRGTSDIALRLTDVDLDALRSVKLSPVGGRLDGWLRFAGTAAAPSLEGSVGLAIRQREGNADVGRIRTDLAWTREGLRLDAVAAPQRGGRLTVNGTLPWRLTLTPSDTSAPVNTRPASPANVDLAVKADSFDLGLFQPLLPPETARELRGRLIADARVTGTPQSPRADGTLRVTGVGVTVPTLDLSYRGGELLGRLAGDELRIERLQLATGKKELLTAQGTVRLRPLNNPALDLTAQLNHFRVSHSDALQAVASGTLHLGGTAQVPVLNGNLTMGRTDIVVGAGTGSATVEKVELTPEDLRQVARRFGPAALEHVDDSPGLVDRFRLDLNLRLPRRVWFRRRASPSAEIELSGRIRLRQEPDQPMQFFGRVEPVPGRGTLDVYGREFRLTGGQIYLGGPVDSTRLDVTAEYRVPTQGGPEDEGVLISVAARGHPDSLSLEFSGDPEMSQDDMLSYIVTGRPSSDNPLAERSGEGTSAGAMGAEVALSGLTQSLSSTAEEELGLDVFQIRQEGLSGLTLTAGRYVGSRVFLSMHMPIELGGESQQTPGTTLGPSFELEYAAQRWLRANIRGGNEPPRFNLRSRYAY